MLTQKGRLVNILGQNVAIAQEPTYPVAKFLTKEEFERFSRDPWNKALITESLRLVNNSLIIIYYVKSNCKTH